MGVGGQRHAPAALPPGKTQYPLLRRLGEPQGRSGQVRKISSPQGFDPRTVQPVASRYTDYAIPAYSKPCIDERCIKIFVENSESKRSLWRDVCPIGRTKIWMILEKSVVWLILENLTACYVVERNAFCGNWRFITIFKLLEAVVIQKYPVHILTSSRLRVFHRKPCFQMSVRFVSLLRATK
jgi:hypothetical protein